MVTQLAGNGNGGAAMATGWQLVTIPRHAAGRHSHAVARGYNNKKNSKSEETTILIEEVVVARQP